VSAFLSHVVARSGIAQIAAGLAPAWPTFLADVFLPVEEDRDGTYHDIRRDVRCAAPCRVDEVSVAVMLSGQRCCPRCLPRSLAPAGRVCVELSARTRLLRTALDSSVAGPDRAFAAVLAIWEGYSRYIPRPVFEGLRVSVLLPLVTGSFSRPPNATGPLVAFTAGDMRLGGSENPALHAVAARAAAGSLVHASPRDGVWLLHDPWRDVPGDAPSYPPLGRVLETAVARSEIDAVACEIFGVLADDALSGTGSWEDIDEWWSAARALSA